MVQLQTLIGSGLAEGNMLISYLGISGTLLNFAGGVFLVYDALRLPRKTLVAYGARSAAEEDARRTSKPPRYIDDKGQPLETLLDWELWLARQTQKWTWVGFVLIAAGFFLDLLSRIFNP
jgi:hypothetical protein